MKRHKGLRTLLVAALAFWGLMVEASPPANASHANTIRVSLRNDGTPVSSFLGAPSASASGNHVAFRSSGALVQGDTNGFEDIFIRRISEASTTRVSVSSAGAQANGGSGSPSISGDGSVTAFVSSASNLVAGDTNAADDVFVHDLSTATTTRISVSSSGAQADAVSSAPSLSRNGRYVAFVSNATNLVSGGQGNPPNVFLHDLLTGQTTLVPIGFAGDAPNNSSSQPSVSEDGRYVAFRSIASNLIVGDTNLSSDIFVRDRALARTLLATQSSQGVIGTDGGWDPAITPDGGLVAFRSFSPNLVVGDTNMDSDVFVRDIVANTTERVSVSSSEEQGNSTSYGPAISSGRFVVFISPASNLVAGDTNFRADVFVRDRQLGTTTRVSLANSGDQADEGSGYPTISTDGRFVSFESMATTLTSDGAFGGIFRRDLGETAAPTVSLLVASSEAFSPNGDGVKDTTTISATITDDSPPLDWTLSIKNTLGQVVRSWSGSEPSSPASISLVWDGHDLNGGVVPDGQYTVVVTALDHWGNAASSSKSVSVDTVGPSISDLLPEDHANTIFASQPLLARVDDSGGSGVAPGTIVFTLTDETLATNQSYSNGQLNYDSASKWAKTPPVPLIEGHVYRAGISLEDQAGNRGSRAHLATSAGGGFLATQAIISQAQALIPRTDCSVSNELDPTGMKTATCVNVQLHIESATAQVNGTRHPGRGLAVFSVPLNSAVISSAVGGLEVFLPAYRDGETQWDPKQKLVTFDVPSESFQAQTYAVPQYNAEIGILTTKVPATWSSAVLSMPAVLVNGEVPACSDPTVPTDMRCQPDFARDGLRTWDPPVDDHYAACDKAVSHRAQTQTVPETDLVLSASVDLGRFLPTTAKLIYSPAGGAPQEMVINDSRSAYEFTIPAAVVLEGTKFAYVFEVAGQPLDENCLDVGVVVAPINHSYQVFATTEPAERNVDLWRSAVESMMAVLDTPGFAQSEASALQACSQFFAAPTPCDLYPERTIDGDGLSGEPNLLDLPQLAIGSQATAASPRTCTINGAGQFYKDWSGRYDQSDTRLLSFGTNYHNSPDTSLEDVPGGRFTTHGVTGRLTQYSETMAVPAFGFAYRLAASQVGMVFKLHSGYGAPSTSVDAELTYHAWGTSTASTGPSDGIIVPTSFARSAAYAPKVDGGIYNLTADQQRQTRLSPKWSLWIGEGVPAVSGVGPSVFPSYKDVYPETPGANGQFNKVPWSSFPMKQDNVYAFFVELTTQAEALAIGIGVDQSSAISLFAGDGSPPCHNFAGLLCPTDPTIHPPAGIQAHQLKLTLVNPDEYWTICPGVLS